MTFGKFLGDQTALLHTDYEKKIYISGAELVQNP